MYPKHYWNVIAFECVVVKIRRLFSAKKRKLIAIQSTIGSNGQVIQDWRMPVVVRWFRYVFPILYIDLYNHSVMPKNERRVFHWKHRRFTLIINIRRCDSSWAPNRTDRSVARSTVILGNIGEFKITRNALSNLITTTKRVSLFQTFHVYRT